MASTCSSWRLRGGARARPVGPSPSVGAPCAIGKQLQQAARQEAPAAHEGAGLGGSAHGGDRVARPATARASDAPYAHSVHFLLFSDERRANTCAGVALLLLFFLDGAEAQSRRARPHRTAVPGCRPGKLLLSNATRATAAAKKLVVAAARTVATARKGGREGRPQEVERARARARVEAAASKVARAGTAQDHACAGTERAKETAVAAEASAVAERAGAEAARGVGTVAAASASKRHVVAIAAARNNCTIRRWTGQHGLIKGAENSPRSDGVENVDVHPPDSGGSG